MNFQEAAIRACQEPTLIDALSWISVWDCDRAVFQARDNNGSYDTCFKILHTEVMKQWEILHPDVNERLQTLEEFLLKYNEWLANPSFISMKPVLELNKKLMEDEDNE